mgnify:CR=1 FL=1
MRFLSATGLTPDQIREQVEQPGFLAAVLEHLVGDVAVLQAGAVSPGQCIVLVTGPGENVVSALRRGGEVGAESLLLVFAANTSVAPETITPALEILQQAGEKTARS